MKTLKRENDAVQQAVRDALGHIKSSVEKLNVALDTEPLVDYDSAECILRAQHMMVSAAEWLNKEFGSEEEYDFTCYAKQHPEDGKYDLTIEEF